jgi:hypothetical protein
MRLSSGSIIDLPRTTQRGFLTVPSNSLTEWRQDAGSALDEIENAHVMVGGSERGRRYATQQINFAYASLLSSRFQGFCRDLHSECIDHLVTLVPATFQGSIRRNFKHERVLDKGNPHPGAIGRDFGRLGIDVWSELYSLDARSERRNTLLAELIAWRNAIAHQDFGRVATGGVARLHLERVRVWRRAINALVRNLELVMYNHLHGMLGRPPW